MSEKSRTPCRPSIPWPEDRTLETIMQHVQARRDQPITRAADKLFQFVNSCVGDEDFRHPQSQHLLNFLLLTRDVLTDHITELWSLDDILEPISAEVRKQGTQHAASARSERFHAKRRAVIDEWLSKPRQRGEKKRFSDEMEAKHGVKADTVRKEWLSKKSLADSA